MKSLERRFRNIADRHYSWSTYTCFAAAVKGQNFTHPIILYWFNKLVDKDDYDHKDKKELMAHIEKLNKATDGHMKRG